MLFGSRSINQSITAKSWKLGVSPSTAVKKVGWESWKPTMAAAAAETAKPSAAHAAFGRSTTSNYDYAFPASSPSSPYNTASSTTGRRKLKLNTSPVSPPPSSTPRPFGDVYNSAGASPASSTTYFPPRSDSRAAGSKMSSSHIASSGSRSESRHAKLHKRGGSGSSIPGSSLPATSSALSQVGSTWEESYTSTSSTPTGSMPKIRPYLCKMSTKEDSEQGRLDLSKSMSENQAFTGLGIQDLGQRSASEVSFTHTAKRSHARTISGESQLSTASGSVRPTNKPFVHPMRQTPRPYTPPHGHSFDSSTMNDEERNESDDVLTDDDFRLGHGFRTRRSVSISSTPVIAPTPLSQSHTALDLSMVPKFTSSSLGNAGNTSQTNLSLKSNRSGKSSKSRPSGTRSRRNTERSFDTPTSTSARTSFDKAFSFASVGGGRRSDTDPLTRDQRIQAARRKFEEREGKKERKAEERVLKRRETEEAKRRKSEASERIKISKKNGAEKAGKKGSAEGVEHETGWSEKAPPGTTVQQQPERKKSCKEDPARPGKFGVWLKMTMLSCGGKG